MKRTLMAVVLTVGFLALASHALRADVRTEQKTHVDLAGLLGRMTSLFGGKAAREDVVSTVAVKGDRKASLNEFNGQIVDLNEEKIYDLDVKRKSYRVTTFAELRRRIEEAQKKAEEDARKDQGKAAEPTSKSQQDMEIDVDIKATGQKKVVNGFDTREVVMTITVRQKGKTVDESGGLVVTADSWLAPKIAAMKEISDFDMRYAQKLYGPTIAGVSAEQMAAAMALYPFLKSALGRLTTEGVKLDGTPIQTTTTVESVKSADQMADEAKRQDSDGKVDASDGVGGLIGGFAKRAMKKKAEGDPKPRTTFMTSTTELLKVATEVAASDVAIPAGFKESR